MAVEQPTAPRRSRPGLDRRLVAVILATTGVMMLAVRLWPAARLDAAVPFALGVELMAWGWVTRRPGPWIAGCLTTGLGVGVLLVALPLAGADGRVLGGAVLVAVSGGFGLLAALSGPVMGRTAHWAWIPGSVFACFGVGLLVSGGEVLPGVLGWAGPVVLLVLAARALARRRV